MANNQLRNISQSAQEREIIKTAPDMVVYIEGLPFILNPYLKQSDSDLVTVNFNDYITAVQTSYTVDSLMPTGSVHLIVPNGLKHLFLAPGGNLIFQVMSSIRIYAKCYFFSKTGNTVFRRIFNGVIKSLEYTETQTGLEISIAIAGIMRLLEIVQMDLSPSLMTEGNFPSQVFRSNQAQMSLYEAIYESFDRAMDFGEFLKYALSQDSVKNSVHGGKDVGVALTQEYMVKWTLRLNDLRRDVRIFGGSGTKKLHDPVEESSKALTDAKKALATKKKADPAKDNPARPVKTADTVTANDKGNKLQLSMLKKYHFDMAVSGIEIAGGHLTPRLERIRQLIELAGLEGYQDIDGLIIVKPPLYNLDSTVLGPLPSNKMDPNDPLSDENLYEEANPYIINMAEVLSENFNEDESGIRKTSMTLTPAWSSPSGLQLVEGHSLTASVVRYVDINLIRRFGVREDTPKYCGFLAKDTLANYGFAVCELNKLNRNYRTYHVTIPMRPELRLGFPIYIPHRDMYGYIVAASISYTVGGQATMSLTCNYIRKRPLLRQLQTVPGADGNPPQDVIVYASQANLVHAWTKKPGSTIFDATGKKGQGLSEAQLQLLNTPGTISNLPSQAPSAAQKAVLDFKRKKMGDLFETWVEDFDAATWRIQRDDADLQLPHTDKKVIEKGGPPWYDGEIDEDTGVKTRSITVDNGYLRRISMIQPYTDEKGYEVIPAFPWGRYSTLRESLVDCTRSYWYEDSASVKEKTQKEFAKASAFLTGGFAIPGGLPAQVLDEAVATSASNSGASQTATYEETTKLFDKFDKSNVISFELNYENGADYGKSEEDFGAAGAKNARPSGLASDNNPNSGSDSPDNSNIVDKLNVFLLGCTSPSNSNNSGPYAVSLLPQNTDIGGFIPSAGPFSGVIASMSATFTSSPYGALFGMRPTVQNTTSAYFTSGYEDQGNSTNPGAASYSSVGTGNVGWSAFKKQF